MKEVIFIFSPIEKISVEYEKSLIGGFKTRGGVGLLPGRPEGTNPEEISG